MVDKQKIIIEHCAGKTNRKIAKKMGLNRKTVNKYVTEYEEARKRELAELLPGTNPLPLTPYILVAPKYDSSNRAKCYSALSARKKPGEIFKFSVASSS